MKQLLMLIFYLFICFSCISVKKEIISKSTIKLQRQKTNIKDLIDIEGYFSQLNRLNDQGYMFFEDGIWVYFHFKRDISEEEIKKNMAKSVNHWFKKGQTKWGTTWGVYTINNDTITVNTYNTGSSFALGSPNSLFQVKYKVINRKTIQSIYFKALLKTESNSNNNLWGKSQALIFTPADSLPSSDNWLKEKKWIWRNESDWEKYMQRIKKEKELRK